MGDSMEETLDSMLALFTHPEQENERSSDVKFPSTPDERKRSKDSSPTIDTRQLAKEAIIQKWLQTDESIESVGELRTKIENVVRIIKQDLTDEALQSPTRDVIQERMEQLKQGSADMSEEQEWAYMRVVQYWAVMQNVIVETFKEYSEEKHQQGFIEYFTWVAWILVVVIMVFLIVLYLDAT